jgi:hypothetical protein
MTSEPTHLATAPAERHQPLWPWLLLPLVTLALFFVLFKLKSADEPSRAGSAHHTEAPASTAPIEDADPN